MQDISAPHSQSVTIPLILSVFYAVATFAMLTATGLALAPEVSGSSKLIGFVSIFSLSLIVGLAAGLVARARLSHLPDDHTQRLVNLNGLFVLTSFIAYDPMASSLTWIAVVGGVYVLANALLLWVAVQNRWLLSTAISLPLIAAGVLMALDGGQVWEWGAYLVGGGVMLPVAARRLAALPADNLWGLFWAIVGFSLLAVVVIVTRGADILSAWLITLVIVGGGVALFSRLPIDPARVGWWDGVAVVVIALSVVDVAFIHDVHHYNGYMAPINDILHGKTLGVDATTQYGLMLPYMLAGIFQITGLPLSYIAFSVMNTVLIIVQYTITYMLLRLMVKRWWLSLLATVLMATLMLTTLWSPHIFPSSGPMRFIFLYLLLMVMALRLWHPVERGWVGRLPEYLILFLAWSWKYEAGVYTTLTYGVLVVFEMVFTRNTRSWEQRIAVIFREAVIAFACAGAALLVFAGVTWLRSGQFPNWGITFEIYQHYTTTEEVYSRLPAAGGIWRFIVTAYLVSVTTIGYRMLTGNLPFEAKQVLLPVGMTIGGFLHFTYWVNNSNVTAARLIPSLFLLVIAIYHFIQHDNRVQPIPIRVGRGFLAVVITTLLIVPFFDVRNTVTEQALKAILSPAFPTMAARYDFVTQHLIQLNTQAPMVVFAPDDYTETDLEAHLIEFDRMIPAEFPDDERVTVIAPLDTTITGLIVNDRVNTLPVSSPGIESFSQTAIDRAAAAISTLQTGDKLIMSWEFDLFWDLHDALLVPLCETFSFNPVMTGEHLAVFVLAAPGEGACQCGMNQVICSNGG